MNETDMARAKRLFEEMRRSYLDALALQGGLDRLLEKYGLPIDGNVHDAAWNGTGLSFEEALAKDAG